MEPVPSRSNLARGAVMVVRRCLSVRSAAGSSVVEFVLVVPLLVFFTFYGIEAWVVIQRHTLLQHVMNTYMVRVQIDGEVSHALREDMLATLADTGFDPGEVSFGNSTSPGIIRHRGESVVLEIGYPRGPILTVLRLVGLDPPDPDGYMWARGTTISERP